MLLARCFTPFAITGFLLAAGWGSPVGAQDTATVKAKAKQKVESKVKSEAKAKEEAKPADEPKAEAKAKAKAKAEPKAKADAKAKAEPKAAAKIEPVNINTDDADTLQELPGVGPVLAKAIIAGRPYKSADDLIKVDGFGEAKIESLRKYIRVQVPKPAEPAKPAAKAKETSKVAAKSATKAEPKAAAKAEPKPLAPGRKININKASAEELEELPGIGPVKAKAIIDGRPFATPEDVMKVRGIKDETFGKIKAHISVN